MDGNRLTEHFTLQEMTRSDTAQRKGICNEPGIEAISNLLWLCQNLETLRHWARCPIRINSGFRCHALNKAVGGAENSQHTRGEAADIFVPDWKTAARWMKWFIRNRQQFDQVILEARRLRKTGRLKEAPDASFSTRMILDEEDRMDAIIEEYSSLPLGLPWIHVSVKRNTSRNRHQVLLLIL